MSSPSPLPSRAPTAAEQPAAPQAWVGGTDLFPSTGLDLTSMPPAPWEAVHVLGSQSRWAEVTGLLRQALLDNPLDAEAARSLFEALGRRGDGAGQRRLARSRRLLRQTAPHAVPAEAWFTATPPVGDELASLIILCCNELDYTRLCLESVLRHTRSPYELILIDNGSSDGTPAYLEGLRSAKGPTRVEVVRNNTNLGYPAGCNQGQARARGRYLVLLNNDTVVTPGWLEGLITLSLHDWPQVGLVGAVSNCVAAPQQVAVDYDSLEGITAFAARRRQAFLGQALPVERLIGFCLLLRREVLEQIGGLDEQFGLGFFDDDDLCLRARTAGFRLALALGVFVHHFGSRTFTGLGIDCPQQLRDNFERFRSKWGAERCAGYRLPEPTAAADREKERPGGPGLEVHAATVGFSPTGQVRVSLCMIVKNEEANLPACLASVADLVDEMVVVDTGSTDRTREVATEAGAWVVDWPWQDSFAAARNESLRQARGQWVLWLDADERLDQDNRRRLFTLLAGLGAENAAYAMRQHSPLEPGLHAAAQVDQIRLFPRHPELRWRYRVHEQILPGLRELGAEVRRTEIVIAHAGFADPRRQGAKVERNLRLLEMEAQECPNDPFILYNLGAIALTQGRAAEALALLQRSLDGLQPTDSLVHKLYALLLRAHQDLGHPEQALAACRAGRALYPHDAELLFWEGVLRHQQGDLAGAETCLLQVLQAPDGQHFSSIDAGLQGYRTRHHLAEVYRQQGRLAEAEAQWRAAVAECPGFHAAWLNLAEVALAQGRWAELEQAADHLRAEANAAVDAAVLRARGHLARHEFASARQLLAETIAQAPQALWPRVILSHVLLQEGSDWAAAERALLDVLALDPHHAEARHNLTLLRRQHGPAEAGDAPEQAVRPDAVAADPPHTVRPRVSLCLIVKNEEANLPACLASVADLVDEIILVDTGSTDGTREVAARFGARVFDWVWVDSFAAARNESLRHATGEFIFWMDADDRLDEENRIRLRALFAGLSAVNAAYVMKCLCLPDPVSGVTTVVDHVRLFRNRPDIRWRYRVHEQILPAVRQSGGEVRWSEVVIQHTGYQDPALRRQKLERDLRLLRREEAEHPDDPFTLFNLGSIFQELGQLAEAIPFFRRSLERSQPGDSIVRKLYALLAQCHRQLGQDGAALAACQAGRQHYPDDAELLFQEGLLRRESGDGAGAEACWQRLLQAPEAAHFASIDTGVRGYKARHNLAVLGQEQGRLAEAEAQWRAALAERPDFLPAWLGLGEVCLAQGRWEEAERTARGLEAPPLQAAVEAALLRSRGQLARHEFPAALGLLGEASARFPADVRLRVLRSHVLLQQGRDWEAAEQALRDVLALDPGHAESRHNLVLLLHQQGKAADAALLQQDELARLYRAACATPSDINEHCPTLCALAQECRHVTELGTRTGVSTIALLSARPDKLVCYDTVKYAPVERLQALAGATRFEFHQADVLAVDIEETDLLFIDTWHVYEQLREELRRHGGKARRYLVLHDTTTFGERGEAEGRRGLWPAVEEFLGQGTFRLKRRYENNHGLTVLERT